METIFSTVYTISLILSKTKYFRLRLSDSYWYGAVWFWVQKKWRSRDPDELGQDGGTNGDCDSLSSCRSQKCGYLSILFAVPGSIISRIKNKRNHASVGRWGGCADCPRCSRKWLWGWQPMRREHLGSSTSMRKGSHSEDNFHKCPITIIMRICYEHSYSENAAEFRFYQDSGKEWGEVRCGVMWDYVNYGSYIQQWDNLKSLLRLVWRGKAGK